jgi:hypothetical protein
MQIKKGNWMPLFLTQSSNLECNGKMWLYAFFFGALHEDTSFCHQVSEFLRKVEIL